MPGSNAKPRLVAVLAFEDVQLLDVAGPVQAFASANELACGTRGAPGDGAPYRIVVVSRRGGAVRSSAQLPLVTEPIAKAIGGKPIDTLILPGGPGVHAAAQDKDCVAWVRRQVVAARRIASVCTGAFLLAEAGALSGRAATTHWKFCGRLQKDYPDIKVEPDPIYLHEGRIWTSAGVSAGIDLSLAMIAEDLGRTLAMQVARHLVVFLNRPGGQSQFSATLEAQAVAASGNAPNHFAPLHDWIADNIGADLRVERLAEQAGMSPRHFARIYAATMGMTPARMVEKIRIEAVRRRLEESETPIKQIAAACGFRQEERLRRAFARQVGTTPAEYRQRF
ncbi:MAG TPA: GlxA family transcriptional regulator [Xanthobacteraceae bacterium]|nr:GlxA family transcriptional regulator [Xanthobacteraceae bacterium]